MKESNNPEDFCLDLIFTPVKMNYQITDSYKIDEKITEILDLEIITNGSIAPNDALNKASLLLQTLFGSLVIDESQATVPPEKTENELGILIEELQLSVRALFETCQY